MNMGLLDLPVELRLLIYHNLFVHHEPIPLYIKPLDFWQTLGSIRLKRWSLSSQALAVSRILHDEGKAVLYGENHFSVDQPHRNSPFWRGSSRKQLLKLPESIWENIADQIRKIKFIAPTHLLASMSSRNTLWVQVLKNVRRVEVRESRFIDEDIEYFKEAPTKAIEAALRKELERSCTYGGLDLDPFPTPDDAATREIWWSIDFKESVYCKGCEPEEQEVPLFAGKVSLKASYFSASR